MSLASELAEDIVASAVTDVCGLDSAAINPQIERSLEGWKLLPPPLPDLTQAAVQVRGDGHVRVAWSPSGAGEAL